MGFTILPKTLINENGESLFIDQYFTDSQTYFFIEQKIRDDHDSTKKRGQLSNFEAKLELLYKKYEGKLKGFIYFIDPNLKKNKNYYLQELKRLEEFYEIDLMIFYGKELFLYFKQGDMWDSMLSWLEIWKESLPELPEINFDNQPEDSFNEIKDLELRYWRKIVEHKQLWDNKVMGAIFKNGKVINMLINYYNSQNSIPYKKLSDMLENILQTYYK